MEVIHKARYRAGICAELPYFQRSYITFQVLLNFSGKNWGSKRLRNVYITS